MARDLSLASYEEESKLIYLVLNSSVYLYTEYNSQCTVCTRPRDSLLSLSGRTCTCCWILLHSTVDFNHMICFCFLSSRCYDNLVYGCPQQQVKHRTPKQKEEFPIPSKQKRFASTAQNKSSYLNKNQ